MHPPRCSGAGVYSPMRQGMWVTECNVAPPPAPETFAVELQHAIVQGGLWAHTTSILSCRRTNRPTEIRTNYQRHSVTVFTSTRRPTTATGRAMRASWVIVVEPDNLVLPWWQWIRGFHNRAVLFDPPTFKLGLQHQKGVISTAM